MINKGFISFSVVPHIYASFCALYKTVRLELDEQYDDLVTIAFVTSVATPSQAATDFVVYMNKLIAETNTAYNQRMAQIGKKKEETSEE